MGPLVSLFVYILIASLLEDSVIAQCTRTTPPCNLVCHCQSGSQCSVNGCGTGGCLKGWDGPTCQRENFVLGFYNNVTGTLGYSSILPGPFPYKSTDGFQTTYFSTYSELNPYLWINLRSVQTVYAFGVVTTAQCTRTTPPCNLVCHCQSGSQCSVNGCGTGGCLKGWDGPTCQRENFVLGFYNNVTGTLGSSSRPPGPFPYKSTDGFQTTYFSTYSELNPYLWINLRSVQTVYAFGVVTTAYDFQIYINNDTTSRDGATLCTSNNAAQTTATERYDVTCYKPLNGQYVWITRPDVTTLNVTEMEIYRCSDYWFGVQCDIPCNCQTRNEVCNKATGECLSGCPRGYAPPGCQDCVNKRYSPDCSNVCGHCKDGRECNEVSGICPNPSPIAPVCEVGYAPDFCQDCIDGRYGTTCSDLCGNCNDEQVCEKDYGECPGGCKDGYEPPLCIECDDGYYGPNCSIPCGDCLDGSPCNKTDGSCLNGCNPGSCPPLCKITAEGRIRATVAPSLPAGYIEAVVVIVVLCVILFITTVVFYMKSRRITRLYQEQVKAKYTHFQVKESGDETPTPEPVYEEMPK